MITEKLYYTDSHIFAFEAKVLECRKEKSSWAVILDRTAFFPEGGGQLADTGYIGSARVTDVQEHGGEILHYTDMPFEPGLTVVCRLDAEQRLRRMQNHSGEHIVSGLIHGKYGYDNVGFHMGAECTTIDFSGELDWEQLMDIEQRANETVRADLPVRVWFPDAEELAQLEYRSKLELTENVRIVEIGEADRCACCAPHVSRTGEVGVIKILDCQRHRGGVRVSVVCGMDAVEDYRAIQTGVTAISRALSAKRGEVAAAVGRILDENTRLKERAAALSAELVHVKAESTAETDGNICVFDDILDEFAQRELTNLLMEKCGGIAAVFSGSDKDGWRYIIGSKTVDLRRETKRINAAINGRGGGAERMIQGRALVEKDYITSEILSLEFDC